MPGITIFLLRHNKGNNIETYIYKQVNINTVINILYYVNIKNIKTTNIHNKINKNTKTKHSHLFNY